MDGVTETFLNEKIEEYWFMKRGDNKGVDIGMHVNICIREKQHKAKPSSA